MCLEGLIRNSQLGNIKRRGENEGRSFSTEVYRAYVGGDVDDEEIRLADDFTDSPAAEVVT